MRLEPALSASDTGFRNPNTTMISEQPQETLSDNDQHRESGHKTHLLLPALGSGVGNATTKDVKAASQKLENKLETIMSSFS